MSECMTQEDAMKMDNTAERKKGYWRMTNKVYPEIFCSNCDVHIPVVSGWRMDAHMNFCPNCGADMRGNDDDI